MSLEAVPIERKEASEFVDKIHRHHDPVVVDRFRVGCMKDGVLVGAAQVATPVARHLCDGETLEVVRVATDGTHNACSFLYSRCARIAKEMGYKKIITYILDSEEGVSLRASGWQIEADIRGHSWSCKSRPRETTAPTCDKQRWCKYL